MYEYSMTHIMTLYVSQIGGLSPGPFAGPTDPSPPLLTPARSRVLAPGIVPGNNNTYIYIYINMYTCFYIYIYIYVYGCVMEYMYVFMCIYVYMYMYSNICILACIHNTYIYVKLYMHLCFYTQV